MAENDAGVVGQEGEAAVGKTNSIALGISLLVIGLPLILADKLRESVPFIQWLLYIAPFATGAAGGFMIWRKWRGNTGWVVVGAGIVLLILVFWLRTWLFGVSYVLSVAGAILVIAGYRSGKKQP